MAAPQFERPTHPDMDRLIEVIAEGFDRAAAQPDFDIESYVGQFIDIKSASYMALQRSMRVLGLNSPVEVMREMNTLMRMSALYLEALTAGIEFERKRT